MRCPKCHYISYDSGERCRNCGYEFSLAAADAALDLPIQTGSEPEGPLADFALGDLDQADSAPQPDGGGAPAARRAFTPSELPLFTDRAPDDDAPLVTPSSVPRAPLAVRRASTAAARPARAATEEPAINLELPNLDETAEYSFPSEPELAATIDPLAAPAASLARRLFAGIVDLAILAGIDAAVLYFTLKIVGFSFAEIALLPLIPLIAFLLMLNGGYLVAFVAAGGQTIGKMAAGIKVVPAEGEAGSFARVPLGTAFLRAAAFILSLAPAGAGLLPALFGADHRAMHDRLAHTRVVRA